MNLSQESFKDLLFCKKYNNLTSILDSLEDILQRNIHSTDSISSQLVSKEFVEDIKRYTSSEIDFYFGQSMKNIKCVIKDRENSREHELYIQYEGAKKLIINSVSLPYSPLQEREYSTIEQILLAYRHHLEGLTGYFYELETIDRCCTVMEPVNPSFKEDYRRILLDDRTWLHVEVTPDGLATNIHLIGQSEYWQDKLQEGLLKWDHDINIVRNIMHIFDITELPSLTSKPSALGLSPEYRSVDKAVCSICLCEELPGVPGVPLPLCQNSTCGMYFHRTCLFQWLVACAGGRPPAFGVANGSCPTCLQPIACNEKES